MHPGADSPADPPLLSVRNLSVAFSRPGPLFRRPGPGASRRSPIVRAVDDVSFDVPRGTTLGVVGESGSGKSTLARAILRLVPAASGEIHFGGVDVLSSGRRGLRRLRRRIQLVFQDASGSLDPRMRVARIIAEPLEVHGLIHRRNSQDTVQQLLERTGLDPAIADRFPHELSGGQRQRVGIARALALRIIPASAAAGRRTPPGSDPLHRSSSLLVLDEPVSALDVSVQAQILNMLADLRDELGLTYLFIAHDLAVVEQFCDHVAVMHRGRIVEYATAGDLYHRPGHPYTLSLLSAVPGTGSIGARPAAPVGAAYSTSVMPADRPIGFENPLAPRMTDGATQGELPGEQPGAGAGCSLYARCRFATETCRDQPPPLRTPDGFPWSHLAACHHAERVVACTRPAADAL